MSADAVANPPATSPGESKSARKKKAKQETTSIAVPTPAEKAISDAGANGSEPAGKANGAGENSYIRELQKNVRNVSKKLSAMAKADGIVAANPGVSIDELVATRKINADQKAQLLKKPSLQAQLAQFEEQLNQYKKFEQEYENKIAQEKEIMQKGHSQELEKLRDTIKAEAALEQKKEFREKFLTLSRFLRAAAARRQLEEDESDLSKAFEGALLLVYGGDASAVAATEKLIDGSSDTVPSTEGIMLDVTYAQIKEAALEEAPFAAEEAWAENVAESGPTDPEGVSTDPTIANAGLTELDATAPVNGGAETEQTSAPAASSIGAGATNAAGGDWEKRQTGADDPLTESYEIVPRDPAETETPAVPAPVNATQSWADEPVEGVVAPNDGFQEVHNSRGGRGRGGQGEARGGFGGRGRGGPRGGGRGGRGGRGRGGPRGGFRGAPRGGESA